MPYDPAEPEVDDPRVADAIDRYWRRNLLVMGVLLVVWAVAGLGCLFPAPSERVGRLIESIREPEGAGPGVDIDAAPEH